MDWCDIMQWGKTTMEWCETMKCFETMEWFETIELCETMERCEIMKWCKTMMVWNHWMIISRLGQGQPHNIMAAYLFLSLT